MKHMKDISLIIIITTLLLVIVAVIIPFPLIYNALVSIITPSPKAPPSVEELPTLPPDQGGGVDANSPIVQNSFAEIQKLYPYLPYSKEVTLSTGVHVSIFLPKSSPHIFPWAQGVNINGIDYETFPAKSDYMTMKKSFKEAANIVFAWIKQDNADPYKIIYAWGGQPFSIQDEAEKWLSEGN